MRPDGTKKRGKRRTAKTVQEKIKLNGRIETKTHATHRQGEGLEQNSLNKTNP
jgi:hypothetical protein